MAGKRFVPMFGGQGDRSKAEEDYKNSERFGPVALGGEHLFWSKPLSVHYAPLSRIAWAYLRGEGGSAAICCGRATFSDHYLMLWDDKGGSAKIPMEHEQTAKSVLAALEGKCPDVAVGYSDQQAKRFAQQPLPE